MKFNEKYALISGQVKNDLQKLEEEIISSINLSAEIDQTLKNFLTNKPKRIRPVVSFLYLRAAEIVPQKCHYTFQTAIEIIHNASLIHDDVVDEADIRRGSATLNKQFNNKTAILTGDYLLSIALQKLNELNSSETISLCADTLAGMCRGEVNQYFNKFKIPTLEQYIKKTEQKTAKLFETAVKGSMLLAGKADTEQAKKFSIAFGMAFQIRDDILNITDKNSQKPTQNDITEGIYNAPVIFAGETKDLTLGIEKTKSLLNNYIDEALKALENLEDNSCKHALIELLGILNNA